MGLSVARAAVALVLATMASCTRDFDALGDGASTDAAAPGSASTSTSETSTTSTGGGLGGAGTGGQGGAGATASSSVSSSIAASSSTVASSSSSSGGPCGNGMLDSGEGCDDGNAVAGDGCSNACMIEGAADSCSPGVSVALGSGIWISDTTQGKSTANNSSCGGGSAGDMVYGVTMPANGTLTVTLDGAFNKVLALRSTCAPSSDDACQHSMQPITETLAVTAGQVVYVYVSGVSSAEGMFTLHIVLG